MVPVQISLRILTQHHKSCMLTHPQVLFQALERVLSVRMPLPRGSLAGQNNSMLRVDYVGIHKA